MIAKLKNPLKYYSWGSRHYLQELLNLPLIPEQTIAEMWMGAHPSASSSLLLPDTEQSLESYISEDPARVLGKALEINGACLPYLFKVLAVDAPLSIQVHPNKAQAKAGFAREEALGIALDDPKRSYKDPHHKPELILAQTPFTALCGFRSYEEIVSFGKSLRLDFFVPSFSDFAQSPHLESFRSFFLDFISLDKERLNPLIHQVHSLARALPEIPREIYSLCLELNAAYPSDLGSLFPLFLNLLQLAPGEAIFLDAGILHAYLRGAGLEIMASSDNVLRAGLTPKHIDPEQFKLVSRFEPYQPPILRPDPSGIIAAPTGDFQLRLLSLDGKQSFEKLSAVPRIIFCSQGNCSLNHSLALTAGESAFLSADETSLTLSGKAELAIAETPA